MRLTWECRAPANAPNARAPCGPRDYAPQGNFGSPCAGPSMWTPTGAMAALASGAAEDQAALQSPRPQAVNDSVNSQKTHLQPPQMTQQRSIEDSVDEVDKCT